MKDFFYHLQKTDFRDCRSNQDTHEYASLKEILKKSLQTFFSPPPFVVQCLDYLETLSIE